MGDKWPINCDLGNSSCTTVYVTESIVRKVPALFESYISRGDGEKITSSAREITMESGDLKWKYERTLVLYEG